MTFAMRELEYIDHVDFLTKSRIFLLAGKLDQQVNPGKFVNFTYFHIFVDLLCYLKKRFRYDSLPEYA